MRAEISPVYDNNIGIWRWFVDIKDPFPIIQFRLVATPTRYGYRNLYATATHTTNTTNAFEKTPQRHYFSVLWNVNRENMKNAFAELYVSCLKNNMQYTRYYMFHHSPTSECTEFAIKMANVLYFAAVISLYYMMSMNYMLTHVLVHCQENKKANM